MTTAICALIPKCYEVRYKEYKRSVRFNKYKYGDCCCFSLFAKFGMIKIKDIHYSKNQNFCTSDKFKECNGNGGFSNWLNKRWFKWFEKDIDIDKAILNKVESQI